MSILQRGRAQLRRLVTGVQHEIVFEDQRAIAVEVGGGLRRYAVGQREILDGYDADEVRPGGAGQILAPWPNRIEDGWYDFSPGTRSPQHAGAGPWRSSRSLAPPTPSGRVKTSSRCRLVVRSRRNGESSPS
jgi:hypothetical protein